MVNCSLCQSQNLRSLDLKDETTIYYHCHDCDLHFLSPEFRLSETEEKARYLHHENDVSDKNYQEFVKPLVNSIQKKMSLESSGLDYGCGPGPVASHLLKTSGFKNIFLYDPFFQNDESLLTQQYDFIFCSEVAEHFFDPHKEFSRLKSLLKPNGILFVYSLLFDPPNNTKSFENWYYRRDPTHVSFYSPKTMTFIAKEFQFKKLETQTTRLVLLYD